MKTMFLRSYGAPAISIALTMVLLLSLSSSTWGQDIESAAQVLPGTTVVYLEVSDPPRLIESVMNHKLRGKVESMDRVQQFLKSPEYTMAMMGKELLEKQLGRSWDEALSNVTSEGLYLGFDIKTQGLAIMFQAKDEAELKKTAETFLNMASFAAQGEGSEKPFTIKPYRECKVADFGDFLIARMGNWFLISNNKDLAKQIADNLLDGSSDSVSHQTWFQEAQAVQGQESIWAAVDLEAIREAGMAQELFAGSVDDPAVELLLGGVLDGMKNAAQVSANLRLDESVQFNLAMPFDSQWASSTREFFYGPAMQGRAPALVNVKNSIASLSTYRDFSAWWLAKEDLFSERVIAQMAEFDSQISTLLAGLDFGEEFLGGLKAGAQLIVVEHQQDPNGQPDVKLPGFAVIAEVKEESFARKVRIAYKNMISIFNLNLGMEGKTQLDTTTEKLDGISLTSAEYVFEDDSEEGLLLYNFSPSIAFVGKHVVVSSTRALALEIANQIKAGDFQAGTDSNTRLELDAKQLHRILVLNKEPLIANNMVSEGNSRSEAGAQIDGMLLIAELFKAGVIDFQVRKDSMNLQLNLEFEE